MKTIIAGSRGFTDYELLKAACEQHTITTVISGTARGADQLGERYAIEKGIHLTRMPANWNLYGKSAGYRRNMEMADIADQLIAFWDGKSPGTKHMIDIATTKGLKVFTYGTQR